MSPSKLFPQWVARTPEFQEIRMPGITIIVGPYLHELGLFVTVGGTVAFGPKRLREEYDLELAKAEAVDLVLDHLTKLGEHVRKAKEQL